MSKHIHPCGFCGTIQCDADCWQSKVERARYVIRAIFYLVVSPIVFAGCLVQATGVALIYALVAVPFGGKRVFVVSYRERSASDQTFKIKVGS